MKLKLKAQLKYIKNILSKYNKTSINNFFVSVIKALPK